MDSQSIYVDVNSIYRDDSSSSLSAMSFTSDERSGKLSRGGPFLDVNGIRIVPSSMNFANAYEGKSFERKLEIQNCGKNLAFIRLSHPNSQAFQIKAFPKGRYLSPGLKIVRTVRFTFSTSSGVLQTIMPIFVNDQLIDYTIFVTLSTPEIFVDPVQLDFGKIDAVHAATSRKLVMWNKGSKGAHFSIDLGRNEMKMVVDPSKGNIPAKSKVILRVELIGSKEGNFTSEFWIKTTPLQRIVVIGTIISPKIVFQRLNDTFDFTMCNFSKTYFGASCTKPLMIQNESSSNSMFCIMAEIKGETMPLEEARKINDSYRNFLISPEEGRMYAERGSIVQVTFSPWKSGNPKDDKDYAACFLRILRMQCCDIEPGFFDDLNAGIAPESLGIRGDSFNSKEFRNPSTTSSPSNETLLHQVSNLDFTRQENSLAICLHGTKQSAKVTILPNKIILNDLQLFEVYDRVLSIKNESQSLPIIVKYVKLPSIEIQPSQYELLRNETFEFTISIRPAKLGRVTTEVKFDLLYYNFPRSNNEIFQSVGSASVRVEYHATSMEKKNMTVCKCDTGKISQLVELSRYRRTADEEMKRHNNNARYQEMIDQKKAITAEKLRKALATGDYELTNEKLLFARNLKCSAQVDPLPLMEKPFSPFIPLMPKQLYNIKIYPTFIRLEKQASHTLTSEEFTIENGNDFPVRIFFKSSKSCVSFGTQERVIIKGGEVKKIPFMFTSYTVGKYNVTIFVVVNESHMFQVSATADVVPKTVYLKHNSCEFTQNEDSFIFVELDNDLNAYVGFEWTVPKSCFHVHPTEGQVPPKRTIVCVLNCNVDPELADCAEAVLTSEGGRSHTLQVTHFKLHSNVVFNTDVVDFETIPLNRTVNKFIYMTNLKCDPVFFSVEDPEPIPGLTITPKAGVVTSKDTQIFEVVVTMKSPVKFSVKVNIIVQNNKYHCITISGIVEFPQIRMTPDALVYRKVSPFSFDRLAFKVQNLSNLFDTIISFPFDDYPELSVTASELQHLPHKNTIILAPREARILFLHFRPYHVTTGALLLPFQLNNIIGPPDIHDSLTTKAFHFVEAHHEELQGFPGVSINDNFIRYLPTVRVSFSATERTVSITNLDICFIYFGDGHYANKTSADVEIVNVSNDPLEMCIRVDSVALPFTFSPHDSNTIEVTVTEFSYLFKMEPSDKVVFSAGYIPENLVHHPPMLRTELPIFIRNYQNDTIFNCIALEGSIKKPTITPSCGVLFFEPSPIGVDSQNQLMLYLENHFPTCTVFAENIHIPYLKITFPEGHKGCNEKGRMPIAFSLTTSSAICFKSKVIFTCTCGISSQVILKGAAENCILTGHSLLLRMRREYQRQSLMKQMFMPSKESIYMVPQSRASGASGEEMTNSFVNDNNKNCFPFFPADDDTSLIAEQKRMVLSSVERWLYCQGFFMKKMYRIPESFAMFPEEVHEPVQSGRTAWVKKEAVVKTAPVPNLAIPLVELILNLTGEHIQNYVTASPPASNTEVERLMFYYKTYQKTLHFLEKFDVNLPNVEAKYLLSYGKYLLYHKLHDKDTDTVFNLSDFNRYTKQCWMDLILQIIKVFVVLRNYKSNVDLILGSFAQSGTSLVEIILSEDLTEIYSHAEGYIAQPDNEVEEPGEASVYHPHEKKLLLWLNNNYNDQRNILWGDSSVPRSVCFFDKDLDDGLVLAALTGAYCPYATRYIRDMYPTPVNPQQIFHNACRLVQTWKMLKFSFEIHPNRIVKPCMVEMLLLVSYLYEILPMYSPTQRYTIQAPLTKSNVAIIELANNSNKGVTYEAVFFGNEKGCYQVKTNIIKIPPRNKKIVAVTYFAKYVHEITACLLLTGEISGQKYSRSFAYDLLGVPDTTFISQEILIEVPIYKTTKLKTCLVSPFKTAAVYKVFLAFNSLETTAGVFYPLEKVLTLVGAKVCRWSDNNIDKFNEEGKCELNLEISPTVPGTTSFWLYFRNDEVGDFGIKVSMTKIISEKNCETINVPIPKGFDALRCNCKPEPDINSKCPKILKVMIPSRNELLWYSRKSTLLRYMHADEKKHWEESLDGPSCNRIIKLLLDSEAKQLPVFAIDDGNTFEVIPNKNNPFICDPTVTITDINSDKAVPLRIHATKNLCDTQCLLHLEAGHPKDGSVPMHSLTCKKEVRFYKLHFIELPSNPTNMQNFLIV